MCDHDGDADSLDVKRSPVWLLVDGSAPVADRYRNLYRQPPSAAKALQLGILLDSCRAASHRSKQTVSAFLEHSRQRESWSPSRRVIYPNLAADRSSFAGCRVLVRTHSGRIQQQVLKVGFDIQDFENALPYAVFTPPIVALKNRVPFTKPLGQVTPRRACLS